jgi:hypothetical protein
VIDVFINPLSANGQHYVTAHVESTIAEMVACFQYILHALKRGRVRLIYDESIEARSLMRNGSGIISEINRLPNGDVTRQWFLYTKNHAIRAQSDVCQVVIYGDDKMELQGEVREEFVHQDSKWLSFGGAPINEHPRLHVSCVDRVGQIR